VRAWDRPVAEVGEAYILDKRSQSQTNGCTCNLTHSRDVGALSVVDDKGHRGQG